MKRRFVPLGLAVLWCVLGCVALPKAAGPVPLEGDGTWYATESKRLSAAHPDLPLGTRVRVTNLLNNRKVIVTITRHIPWTGKQIIDVAQEAAKNIGMEDEGPTPVSLEVLRGRRTLPPDSY